MILAGGLLLLANLYVQGPVVQRKIRARLSELVHLPVDFRKITVTPWDGLRIDGIAAPSAGKDPNSLIHFSSKSFRIRLAYFPMLIRQEVILRLVLLDQPELTWRQNAKGQWKWPDSLANDDKNQVAFFWNDLHTGTFPSVLVKKIKLRHGNLNLQENKGESLGSFQNINLTATSGLLNHYKGFLWVDNLALLRNRIHLTNFWANYFFRPDLVRFTHGHADIGGGKIQLNYTLKPQENGSPFELNAHIYGISLDKLFKESGIHTEIANGILEGSLELTGLTASVPSQRGKGHLNLIDPKLQRIPLIQMLGELLRIDDLQHLRLQTLHADYTIEGTVLHINPLIAEGKNLQLQAQGDYHMDNEALNLKLRLIIDEAIMQQLPRLIAKSFARVEGAEANPHYYLDFNVDGTLSKPHSDLLDKALSRPLQNVLQNLLIPKAKGEN